MTHVGYIVAAYAATFGAVGAYAVWVLSRSRAVARALDSQAATEPPPVDTAGARSLTP